MADDDFWELIAPDLGPDPEWYREVEEPDMPARRRRKSYRPSYTLCSTRYGKKRAYRDKVSAMLAVASARKKDSSYRLDMEQRVYYHSVCHKWHTTHQPVKEW